MGKELKVTTYGGLTVNKETAEKLQNKGPAEFLKIEKISDNEYHVRTKLPEKGCDNDWGTYNIRKNINYFAKALATHAFDKNGDFDFSGISDYYDKVISEIKFSNLEFKNLVKTLDIPDKEKEDFENFYNVNKDIIGNIGENFYNVCREINNFQFGVYNLYNGRDPDTMYEREKYLRGSYEDFKNCVNNLRTLTTADPETLDEILFPLDCINSSTMNHFLAEQVNNAREASQPRFKGEAMRIDICNTTRPEIKKRQANGEKIEINFDEHRCFVAEIGQSGDEDSFILSLETTAPPKGKMIFCPKEGITACGLYENRDALISYHIKNCVVPAQSKEGEDGIRRCDEKNLSKNKTFLRGCMEFELEKRISVKETSHTLLTLTERLTSYSVDNPLKKSSPEFKNLRTAFEKLAEAKTEGEKTLCMRTLNTAAQTYLEYKDPMLDRRAESKLSDYAKRRIEFVRDVLDFTSAELNKKGITPTVVSRTGKLYTMLAERFAGKGKNENETKAKTDAVLHSRTFAKAVNGLKEADLEQLLAIPEKTLQETYKNMVNAEKQQKQHTEVTKNVPKPINPMMN